MNADRAQTMDALPPGAGTERAIQGTGDAGAPRAQRGAGRTGIGGRVEESHGARVSGRSSTVERVYAHPFGGILWGWRTIVVHTDATRHTELLSALRGVEIDLHEISTPPAIAQRILQNADIVVPSPLSNTR